MRSPGIDSELSYTSSKLLLLLPQVGMGKGQESRLASHLVQYQHMASMAAQLL